MNIAGVLIQAIIELCIETVHDKVSDKPMSERFKNLLMIQAHNQFNNA